MKFKILSAVILICMSLMIVSCSSFSIGTRSEPRYERRYERNPGLLRTLPHMAIDANIRVWNWFTIRAGVSMLSLIFPTITTSKAIITASVKPNGR